MGGGGRAELAAEGGGGGEGGGVAAPLRLAPPRCRGAAGGCIDPMGGSVSPPATLLRSPSWGGGAREEPGVKRGGRESLGSLTGLAA